MTVSNPIVTKLLASDNSYKEKVPKFFSIGPLFGQANRREERAAYELGVKVGFDAGVQHAQQDLVNIWHPGESDIRMIEFREKLLALHKEYGVRLQYHTLHGLGVVKLQ